jgi:hypothetical protein
MDLGDDGFLSPPAAPQVVSLPVLDLNGPKVLSSAGLAVTALPKDENDQGNIIKAANATAINAMAPGAFNLSLENQITGENAAAGVTGSQMPHPEPSMKVSKHTCLQIAFSRAS